MRYWQHGETGTCCAVIDDIDLSRSHFEITKDQYDLHEGAKNTEQRVRPDKLMLAGKLHVGMTHHRQTSLADGSQGGNV